MCCKLPNVDVCHIISLSPYHYAHLSFQPPESQLYNFCGTITPSISLWVHKWEPLNANNNQQTKKVCTNKESTCWQRKWVWGERKRTRKWKKEGEDKQRKSGKWSADLHNWLLLTVFQPPCRKTSVRKVTEAATQLAPATLTPYIPIPCHFWHICWSSAHLPSIFFPNDATCPWNNFLWLELLQYISIWTHRLIPCL